MWEWIGCIASLLLIVACVLFVFFNSRKSTRSIALDDIVGERCTVIEKIDGYAGCGIVRVKGTEWAARGVDEDDIFKTGETLTVVAIEGVKLICKKN